MVVGSMVQDDRVRTQRRRVLISGTIGTTIEYFDFLLFGLIAPVVINQLFFGARGEHAQRGGARLGLAGAVPAQRGARGRRRVRPHPDRR